MDRARLHQPVLPSQTRKHIMLWLTTPAEAYYMQIAEQSGVPATVLCSGRLKHD